MHNKNWGAGAQNHMCDILRRRVVHGRRVISFMGMYFLYLITRTKVDQFSKPVTHFVKRDYQKDRISAEDVKGILFLLLFMSQISIVRNHANLRCTCSLLKRPSNDILNRILD